MENNAGLVILSTALAISGGGSGVLTLRDYLAPKFSSSEGSAVLNIETYIDGKNQPTHPSVIDMGQKWHGFRYWMSYSPYPNSDGAEENPCVCGSNNMIHWSTPDGLYNPIAFNEETACDELKDPHIVYNDDTAMLELWYLGRIDSTIKSGGMLLLFRKTSSDGIHWSKYEVMREFAGYTSPSIVYERGKYKLWAIQPSTANSSGALAYMESSDGKSWSAAEQCTFDGSCEIGKIWHGAVSHDDMYRLVFIERAGNGDAVLYAESTDGVSWTAPRRIVQKANFWRGFYRPCILRSDNSFYCIYGVITKDNEWYLSMSTGDSPDNLHGIAIHDVGKSEINTAISAKHSLMRPVKDVYRFVQSLCRPELVLICAVAAAGLLLIPQCSFALLWGTLWLLCTIRFYSLIGWLTLSKKFLLIFTTGIISMLCAMITG